MLHRRQQIAKSLATRRNKAETSRQATLIIQKRRTPASNIPPTMHCILLGSQLQIIDDASKASRQPGTQPSPGPRVVRVLAFAKPRLGGNPWRDDCAHSPCRPLANHGLHERVNFNPHLGHGRAGAAAGGGRTGQHPTGRALEAARTEARKGYGSPGHPSSAKAEDGGARVPELQRIGRAENNRLSRPTKITYK